MSRFENSNLTFARRLTCLTGICWSVEGSSQLGDDAVHDAAALQLLSHLLELVPDELSDLDFRLEITLVQREGLVQVLFHNCDDCLTCVEPGAARWIEEDTVGGDSV